ncbi:recombinase family protein, partial [Aeromonas sp. s6]
MGQVIGYARVSSVGQSLDVQLDKLTKAGCERVYQEKVSGTSTDGREQLAELLRYVREGDDVVITKLDRLGRSLADLLDITEQLEAKGVTLRVLDQNLET